MCFAGAAAAAAAAAAASGNSAAAAAAAAGEDIMARLSQATVPFSEYAPRLEVACG